MRKGNSNLQAGAVDGQNTLFVSMEVLTITVFPCSIQNCVPASQAVVTFTYLGDYFQFSVQSLSFSTVPKLTKPKNLSNQIF